MKKYIRAEGADGNGFPGGLRLSWPALAVVCAALTVVFYLQEKFERPLYQRLTRIENKLDSFNDCLIDHIKDREAHTYKYKIEGYELLTDHPTRVKGPRI